MAKKTKTTKKRVVVINRLREIMEEKQITGYKMSTDLGIPNQFIYSFLMKKDYAPNIATALVLSEYLNTPITKLFELKK